jgi:hypothetical protein
MAEVALAAGLKVVFQQSALFNICVSLILSVDTVTGCRQREVANWSNCVARDFRALASPCPGVANSLYSWPHETLCVQLRCCFGVWVRQIVAGAEHLSH